MLEPHAAALAAQHRTLADVDTLLDPTQGCRIRTRGHGFAPRVGLPVHVDQGTTLT